MKIDPLLARSVKLQTSSCKPNCVYLQLVAHNLKLPQSNIQQQTSRVFQQVLDGHQESHGFFTIDQAVIVRQCQVHHWADHDLAVDGHRTLDDVVHAQNRCLRRVDDRGRHHRTEGTTVGDGEGTTGHLVDGQLAVTGFLAEASDAAFDFSQAHQLGVTQNRYDQATVAGHGNADVGITVVNDVAAVDG